MTKTKAAWLGGGSSAAVIAAVVAVAAVVAPNPPLEIKYEAPATVAAGTVGIIDVSATGADSYAYSVHPPLACHVFEGGTKLVFASPGGGEFVFVVAAAKDGQIGLVEITIPVEGGVPEPVPPSPETFKSRLTSAVATVSHATKSKEADSLAANYETVASMISAGIIKDPEQIEKVTLERNVETLGPNRQAWSRVSAVVTAEITAREEAGTLNYADLWREIAAVLRGNNV